MSDRLLISEKEERILAARATFIARETVELKTRATTSLFVFSMGDKQKYGIDQGRVDKVIIGQHVTIVPGVNPLLSGLLYHDAEIWPVINTSVLLNCRQTNPEANFILFSDGSYRYALSIGLIIGQIPYDQSAELTCLAQENTLQHRYVLGVYQSDIALLDLSAILNVLKSMKIHN